MKNKADTKEKSELAAAAKDGDMKAVEEALAKRIYDRLVGYPYGYGYTTPVTYDTVASINALKSFHDYVKSYETLNGLVYPAFPYGYPYASIYDLVIDDNGHFKSDALKELKKDKDEKKDDKPKDKSKL